jgi:hypothetical protein
MDFFAHIDKHKKAGHLNRTMHHHMPVGNDLVQQFIELDKIR